MLYVQHHNSTIQSSLVAFPLCWFGKFFEFYKIMVITTLQNCRFWLDILCIITSVSLKPDYGNWDFVNVPKQGTSNFTNELLTGYALNASMHTGMQFHQVIISHPLQNNCRYLTHRLLHSLIPIDLVWESLGSCKQWVTLNKIAQCLQLCIICW